MKKTMKILSVVMVVAVLMLTMTLAYNAPFEVNGNAAGVSAVNAKINQIGSNIAGIIYTAGFAIAVVVIVIFGVQWIVATPAKKADLKQKAVNIVIGVAILVGATFLLGTVATFFEGFTRDGNLPEQSSSSSVKSSEP